MAVLAKNVCAVIVREHRTNRMIPPANSKMIVSFNCYPMTFYINKFG